MQEEIQFRKARMDSPDSMLTYFLHQGSPVYFLAALIVCTHQSWDSQRNAAPVQDLSCWRDWQHQLVYWLLQGIYEKNNKHQYRIHTRCTNNWRNVGPYMYIGEGNQRRASIDTLNHHIDQHLMDISIDTWLTLDQIFNIPVHLIDTWSMSDWCLIDTSSISSDSNLSIATRCMFMKSSRLLTDCRQRCH